MILLHCGERRNAPFRRFAPGRSRASYWWAWWTAEGSKPRPP